MTIVKGPTPFFMEGERCGRKGGYRMITREGRESFPAINISLREPMSVIFKQEGGVFFVQNDVASGYGATPPEAMFSFWQELFILWHLVAKEDDKKLTADAIELKNKLLKLIKEN